MGISRADLTDLATTRLATIPNSTHYLAEVPTTPPTVSTADMRVRAYTVLWPTPGAPGDESASLAGTVVDTEWRFVIACVAGLTELLIPLIDLVDQKFHGWEPELEGFTVGRVEQDYDPGPPQPDRSFTPIRFYQQMPYVLRVGA